MRDSPGLGITKSTVFRNINPLSLLFFLTERKWNHAKQWKTYWQWSFLQQGQLSSHGKSRRWPQSPSTQRISKKTLFKNKYQKKLFMIKNVQREVGNECEDQYHLQLRIDSVNSTNLIFVVIVLKICTWNHNLFCCIDNSSVGFGCWIDVGCNLFYRFTFNKNICVEGSICVNNFTTFDEKSHWVTLSRQVTLFYKQTWKFY